MLRLWLTDDHVVLERTRLDRALAVRRRVRLPRSRIHRAFVLDRGFAVSASPKLPLPGWSTEWARVGRFGYGEAAQLWSARGRPVVLALYLRGEPYHRVVLDVDDPIRFAAEINAWLRHDTSRPSTRTAVDAE